jgi:hypothetical protein
VELLNKHFYKLKFDEKGLIGSPNYGKSIELETEIKNNNAKIIAKKGVKRSRYYDEATQAASEFNQAFDRWSQGCSF